MVSGKWPYLGVLFGVLVTALDRYREVYVRVLAKIALIRQYIQAPSLRLRAQPDRKVLWVAQSERRTIQREKSAMGSQTGGKKGQLNIKKRLSAVRR